MKKNKLDKLDLNSVAGGVQFDFHKSGQMSAKSQADLMQGIKDGKYSFTQDRDGNKFLVIE